VANELKPCHLVETGQGLSLQKRSIINNRPSSLLHFCLQNKTFTDWSETKLDDKETLRFTQDNFRLSSLPSGSLSCFYLRAPWLCKAWTHNEVKQVLMVGCHAPPIKLQIQSIAGMDVGVSFKNFCLWCFALDSIWLRSHPSSLKEEPRPSQST